MPSAFHADLSGVSVSFFTSPAVRMACRADLAVVESYSLKRACLIRDVVPPDLVTLIDVSAVLLYAGLLPLSRSSTSSQLVKVYRL